MVSCEIIKEGEEGAKKGQRWKMRPFIVIETPL
jgi:hypothetical protein